MANFTLFHENSVIKVQPEEQLHHVAKLCTVRNRVFVLSSSQDLFFSDIDPLVDSSAFVLKLQLIRRSVQDVACDGDMIYLIDNGRVWQTKATGSTLENALNWKELPIPSHKMCPHGVRNVTEQVHVAHVNCNNDGVLFTTSNRELYGMGEFSEILVSDVPVRIECFRGLKIMQVATGNNFVVVLTQKKVHSENQKSNSVNSNEDNLSVTSDSSDSFINVDCLKCVPEPDTTHLNLLKISNYAHFHNNVSKSTTETSMASSPCPSDNTFEEDLDAVPSAADKAIGDNNATPLKGPKDSSSALNFLLDLSFNGEEYIEQTKLLTGNVTKNITSMLSEGVKTLSRHMSGSDNNESSIDLETVASLTPTKDRAQKMLGLAHDDASEGSSSCPDLRGSAFDVRAEFGMECKIEKIDRVGGALIGTNVWCFGSVNKGQLGTGDHIKRTRMNSVLGLSGQGVIKIECGKEHSAALTIDGRMFLWGNNNRNQISSDKIDDFSVPHRYRGLEPVLNVACGAGQTVILSNDLRICDQSHSHQTGRLGTATDCPMLPTLSTGSASSSSSIPHNIVSVHYTQTPVEPILASGSFVVHNHAKYVGSVSRHLTSEQQFLQEGLQNYGLTVRPLMKKLTAFRFSHALDQLCQQYQVVLHAVALNVRTLAEFHAGRVTCTDIAVLNNTAELVTIFRTYTKRYCDVLCVNGFKQLEQLIKLNGDTLKTLFNSPLQRVWAYIDLICDLIKMEASNGTDEDDNDVNRLLLQDRRLAWEKCSNRKDVLIDEAEETLRFWERNAKVPAVLKLQSPERRLVLDSKQVPLKGGSNLLPKSNNNKFVLFSDLLCCIQANSTLLMLPLKTLWPSSIADNDSRTNAFKVTTPLDTIILVAQNHEDKLRWLQSLENCIRVALACPLALKVPQYRNASFTFPDKCVRYAGCKYFGRWYLGAMHGVGHLEFPDGRVYYGQMSNNEIHGFGKMYSPNGAGVYEGDFERGKYHGYGVLEWSSHKTIYEGSFKEGHFSGHGTLISDWETYVGEFQNGQKNGYGVLDEHGSGDKYMGMFQEDKRHGLGICITMAGDYFEGQFEKDRLSGEGVASFETPSTSSYYEGEMTITGPNGKGAMYIGRQEAKTNDITIVDDREATAMDGVIVKGNNLSGTWQSIKIGNGSLLMDQQFPKYSRLFGRLAIEPDGKWTTLFHDWSVQLFGANILTADDSHSYEHKLIWGQIAVFAQTTKSKEKLRSDNVMTKNFNSVFNNNSKNNNNASSNHRKDSLKTGCQLLSESNSLDNLSMRSHQGSNLTQNNPVFTANLKASTSHLSLNEKTDRSKGHGADGPQMDMDLLSLKLENHFDDDLNSMVPDNKLVATFNASSTTPTNTMSRVMGKSLSPNPHLDFVPSFGISRCETKQELDMIKRYLSEAFRDVHHPLGVLSSKLSYCFYSSYGCWKIKPTPILYTHAMREWESITRRIYAIVLRMFPGLPADADHIDGEWVSYRFILYPILLSEGIYSLLFVLYASKCSQKDELYRQRLIASEKKTDLELANALRIEERFFPIIKSNLFEEAIGYLKQLKDKYCPMEMLQLIEKTFQAIELAKQETCDRDCPLNTDNVIPLIIFTVIRANVQHLGAEISLLEDLMGSDFDPIMHGYIGYCFTTIKASYQHILSDKFFS